MDELALESYGYTDIGHKRKLNEDYFDMNDSLFILADGMGGHNAGEVASQLAVHSTIKYFDYVSHNGLIDENDEFHVQQIIRHAVDKTNKNVYLKSREDLTLQGMGTTLVLALYQRPNTIHIANVGDSRAYLYRNDKLRVLTEDHSVTGTMVRNGTITEKEAKYHSYRHHLTKSIGNSEQVIPFTRFLTIESGDKLLLCSDGLWNVLSNKEIIKTLQKDHSIKKICTKLIEKARNQLSEDNITAIIIKVK